MKAILVIDEMPKDCASGCLVKCKMRGINHRPSWCPLKPIPQRKEELHYPCNEYVQAVNEGFNACIDEILGE